MNIKKIVTLFSAITIGCCAFAGARIPTSHTASANATTTTSISIHKIEGTMPTPTFDGVYKEDEGWGDLYLTFPARR